MDIRFPWLGRAISRRRVLGAGLGAGLSAGGAAVSAGLGAAERGKLVPDASGVPGAPICWSSGYGSDAHGGNSTVGQVDHARNGFDPHKILTDWDTGAVSTRADGRRVREYEITAIDKELEIAPGIFFPAWTYNGRVPGPTIRATEGDIVRIAFRNAGSHPHTIHFHGIHNASMDGIPGAGQISPGETFTYEFTAKPFGCHLYHCHSLPLKRHMHKGLYGAFIVDPDPARHPDHPNIARSRLLGTKENAIWQEFIMVMNGFDTNFDEENEVYAVNSIAFAYQDKPIRIARERPVRVYLVNVTEFDPVNSFHLHANFFDYYDHGTTLTPTHRIVDTIMQCQAQRGIIEFSFAEHEPGMYMFHAHQAEFAELGWMANFEVVA